MEASPALNNRQLKLLTNILENSMSKLPILTKNITV